MAIKGTFIKDLLAGLTVSFAALSLGAAFGTMSGRGAFAGMIGAAIIPIITSIFGGTRIQASGPTAPMTAITALVVAQAYELFPEKQFAEQFITLTILLSGVLMIVAGLVRLGKLISFVPHAVVLGFMNGIAVLIWWDQISKLLGLNGKTALTGNTLLNTTITVATLVFVFMIPWLVRKIGVPKNYRSFFSAILITIILLSLLINVLGVETQMVSLGASFDSFGEYARLLTSYFPTAEMLQTSVLVPALKLAGQLTLLGYLDSLLTSLVVDNMMGEKTKKNKELMAQGLGNIGSGLLQGIPGAQATIRSVLLVNENAQTRLAGILMGAFVLLFILVFQDLITLIPAAVFAGVLIKAGWDVCDRDYTEVYFRKGWYKLFVRNFQMGIILYTTIITVIFDLNIAVITGTLLFYLIKYLFRKKQLKDVEEEFEEEID